MKQTEGMKLCELTVNEDGIRFRHANPHPLSAHQKYNLILSVIGCAAACTALLGFFSLLQ